MRSRFGAMLALALVLCASPALANDISNWSTTDANNNATPPNGWPSGTMLPSQVEPTGRSMMGAIARWYALMGGANSGSITNTTAVRAATTASYPNGFFRLTDGAASAPPLRYTVDNSSFCIADDGGSCIAASGGGYFIAQFPGNVADIREFGVVGDNATDNSIALQNAFSWANKTGGTLYIPNQIFYSAGGVSVIVPAKGSVRAQGSGSLRFGSSATNGIDISVSDPFSTVHLRDFTILASGAMPSAAAIHLHRTDNEAAGITNAVSDITGLTIEGSDGLAQVNYWGTGIYTDYLSNITISNINYNGSAAALGTAINLAGGGSATGYGIVYNLIGVNVYSCNIGVNYGSYIQGVTINQSNFTGCKYGVFSNNAAGAAQLNVSDSQFATRLASISDQSAIGIPDINIHHNLFYPLSAGQNANVIATTTIAEISITDNMINGANATDGFTYNAIAISGGGAASRGVIIGNVISNISTGIVLGSTVQGLRIADNKMFGVTTQYATSGSPAAVTNLISLHNPAFVGVSNVGATGLSPNWVQLTVSTTAGFYTGEWVCVNGTTAAPDPVANVCTTISVTDGTHLVLQGVGASGSSTASGGLVSAIP